MKTKIIIETTIVMKDKIIETIEKTLILKDKKEIANYLAI